MAERHVMLIKSKTHDAGLASAAHIIDSMRDTLSIDCAANGGKLVSLHWTLGVYDVVAIIELDSVKVPTLKLQSEYDLAHEVVVMRALSTNEARDAHAKWVVPQTGHRG